MPRGADAVFQVESSPLRFTAEGRLLSAHVYVSDGILQVPDELRYLATATTAQSLMELFCNMHILNNICAVGNFDGSDCDPQAQQDNDSSLTSL